MISTRDLCVTFGGVVALEGVSVQVPAGCILVVTGPNAAGKSTLLRALAGEVTYRGRVDLPASARPPRVGFLRGGPAALPSQPTARGFFADWCRALGPAGQSMAQSIPRISAALGLDTAMDRPFSTLSDGTRRKVLLARLLVQPVEVLLLDEPGRELDQDSRARLREELLDLASRGTSILLVSHEPEDAAVLAHQMLRLEAGNVKSLVRTARCSCAVG